ncbi:MAG TPA: hypothetical protein VIH54_19275 [Chthoniobacterales bacterium]
MRGSEKQAVADQGSYACGDAFQCGRNGFHNRDIHPGSYHTDSGRLLLSLWDLLGADSVFLLLACGCRLSLFLRYLLARGFRRFVTHTER